MTTHPDGKSRPLRRIRRRAMQRCALAASTYAAAGGPERLRRCGRMFGELHYWLGWPLWHRLRRDIATALGVSGRRAGIILHSAFRENDRAVFEIFALSNPRWDPAVMIDPVVIDGIERVNQCGYRDHGAIVLGMHMGNGVLLAAALARGGLPVHVVFREPRRLPPGLLGRSLERAGCVPVPLARTNPTRGFRRMLAILNTGGIIYALMDQANKTEGEIRTFLGKPMRMPSGVPELAARTGAPVIPVHAVAAEPAWRFRVGDALVSQQPEIMLDKICAIMQARIREHPELWAWHHRRWKRYPFPSAQQNQTRRLPCR